MLLPPILFASSPLRHVVLDGPYQAVRIIPDKTISKRYVVRISETKSTSIFNTRGNYVRPLRVRSREHRCVRVYLIKRDNREIKIIHCVTRVVTNLYEYFRSFWKTVIICTRKNSAAYDISCGSHAWWSMIIKWRTNNRSEARGRNVNISRSRFVVSRGVCLNAWSTIHQGEMRPSVRCTSVGKAYLIYAPSAAIITKTHLYTIRP